MINQRIHYQLFNGQVVNYDTGGHNVLTNDLISMLAMMYYEKTNELPSSVYTGPSAYMDIMNNILAPSTNINNSEKLYMQMNTAVGIIPVIVVPNPGPEFVMVGQDKDYQRYNLDRVFEEQVLK